MTPGATPDDVADSPRETHVIDGREVALTSPDRVLWPATGFTKRDLHAYYLAVAPWLVPHLAGRPLTLMRFPHGVTARGFQQMECRGHPAWMRVAPLTLRTGAVRRYCVVDDAASLAWVANLSAIELHPYLAPGGGDLAPVVAFDLDPSPPRGFGEACEVALALRAVLAAEGVDAVAKTSGARGMHVFVPIDPPRPFEVTRAFARRVAARLVTAAPAGVSDSTRPHERAGKVYVDWMQNSPRRSTVRPTRCARRRVRAPRRRSAGTRSSARRPPARTSRAIPRACAAGSRTPATRSRARSSRRRRCRTRPLRRRVRNPARHAPTPLARRRSPG